MPVSSNPDAVVAPQPAGLGRRLASLFYEALLLLALLMVAGFLVVGWLDPLASMMQRLTLQGYLLFCAGLYLSLSWHWGGQTLAMKTWRIRLITRDGARPGMGRCALRYVLAVIGLLAGGLGFFWALWDRDRQFLHDRLAATRLVLSGPLGAPQGKNGAQAEQAQGGEGA